jgi:hypothetical protein
MQYVRISKVTKNLNLVVTGNYNIPGVIVDYRETRLVTVDHLEKSYSEGRARITWSFITVIRDGCYRENKCLFIRNQNKPDQYFLCLKKREDDTKRRNAVHEFITYNIYMYIKEEER